jgi:solute carrier family 25 (mitochondrial aspartate/glutamate transporter), member 12/13
MDMVERVIREATAKSKDGRIDQNDFLNYASATTRYGLFSPMEASIIFHFAGRGQPGQRLALIDFASLLDPRWKSPAEVDEAKLKAAAGASFTQTVFQSTWNFVLGGLAGGTGALAVYPIDLGELVVIRLEEPR